MAVQVAVVGRRRGGTGRAGDDPGNCCRSNPTTRRDVLCRKRGLVALFALGLVIIPSFAEPARAAAVGTWVAVGCVAFGARWKLPTLQSTGSVLQVGATIAALHWLEPGEYALWGAVFAAEALAGCALAGPWRTGAALAAALAVGGSLASESSFHSDWPAVTAGLLAAAALSQAGRSHRAGWTWVGSLGLLIGVAHLVLLRMEPTPPLPIAVVLLGHASLVLPAALVLRRRTARRGPFSAARCFDPELARRYWR